MLEQMLRTGGHAVLLQIRRRSAHSHATRGETPRDDACAAHLPRDHHAYVEAFFHQIDLTVDQRDVGDDFRIALRVRLKHGREIVQPEHHRRDDSQRTDGFVIARDHHLLDVFQFVENLARALEIDLAGFGQRQAASGAIEQPRTKTAFEVGNVTGGHCVGNIHRARSAGKTAEIRHFDENSHRLQMIHRTTPAVLLLPDN